MPSPSTHAARLVVPSGPQYGTVERAWLALMTEAEKVSELHQGVKNSLMNVDFEKVKNWQKDTYHKQMMGGFKETKEADESFRKAQKPWAKKLKEVRKSMRPSARKQIRSVFVCLARGCQEVLPHGPQGGEGGLHQRSQQQGRKLHDSRPAEEAPRQIGQMQTGEREGEKATSCPFNRRLQRPP